MFMDLYCNLNEYPYMKESAINSKSQQEVISVNNKCNCKQYLTNILMKKAYVNYIIIFINKIIFANHEATNAKVLIQGIPRVYTPA